FSVSNEKTVIVRNFPHGEELKDVAGKPWSDRKPAAVYVGTVTPQRGIREIVAAAGMLSDSLDATLEIAGEPVPPSIQRPTGCARVRHHGVLDQPATYQLLRQVRVGLSCQHPIPTFLDSLPVKIFEYMGAGLPVVVSNFPLWRSLLEDVRCAIFVDPMDP